MPMMIMYQKTIQFTDTESLSLRIINLDDNPEYEKVTRTLASLSGLELPPYKYEIMVIRLIGEHEVESYFNDRYETIDQAMETLKLMEDTSKNNIEHLQEWPFEDSLLMFLYNHRN